MSEPSINAPADFSAVINFWFGEPDSPERGKARPQWFRKDPKFDEEIRARFLDLHEAALAGRLDHWGETPQGALALIVALDQFARNMFRDSPRAFAADAAALGHARRAVERGFDASMSVVERTFMYLPFEHSEDLVMQQRSVELFDSLSAAKDSAGFIDYAHKHYEVIARFGRFPHRNAILGRQSTPEELEYLSQPGAGF